MRARNIAPDEHIYDVLITSLVREKRIGEAESLFVAMRNAGLKASPGTWKYVIEGLSRSNQLDKAMLLVDQMLLEGYSIPQTLSHILQTQCSRKGKQEWYSSRFGVAITNNKVLDNQLQSAILDHWKKHPFGFEWNVEGKPFSLLEQERDWKKQEKEKDRERLLKLEKTYLTSDLPTQLKSSMEENRKILDQKKTTPISVKKLKKKATKTKLGARKEKLEKIGKADPFMKKEFLEKLDKKIHRKPLSTAKRTAKPASQFYWGRHRGPKVK
eukprot:TRINITY_DN4854_c0_g2_i6.p1 TRINITY_DN4854_c0_g2~~TRINITY_DN4854_c0_g2_i6.p1  ORF type:complete len:270 (-),score=70.16 TRINITY_DN4854_c0_g2_i6:76-885(-)